MTYLEIGRMCLKTAGREAGSYCVVVGDVDKDHVMITGPRVVTRVRRRKCNVRHLEPVPVKLDIKKDASDAEVIKTMEKGKVFGKLSLVKPSEEEIRRAEERKKEKRSKKKEEKKPEKKEEKKKEKKEKPAEKKEKTEGKKPEKPKKAGKKKAGNKK